MALGGAHPAQGLTQYFSGVVPNQTNVWSPGWNYYRYNYDFSSGNTSSGPLVRVQEHLTNGNWVYTYSARGWIDICHTRTYTETGCANRETYSISMTCYKQVELC